MEDKNIQSLKIKIREIRKTTSNFSLNKKYDYFFKKIFCMRNNRKTS